MRKLRNRRSELKNLEREYATCEGKSSHEIPQFVLTTIPEGGPLRETPSENKESGRKEREGGGEIAVARCGENRGKKKRGMMSYCKKSDARYGKIQGAASGEAGRTNEMGGDTCAVGWYVAEPWGESWGPRAHEKGKKLKSRENYRLGKTSKEKKKKKRKGKKKQPVAFSRRLTRQRQGGCDTEGWRMQPWGKRATSSGALTQEGENKPRWAGSVSNWSRA